MSRTILRRNAIAVAVGMVQIACSSPGKQAEVNVQRAREILTAYIDQKYSLLRDTRQRIRSNPDLVKILRFMDGAEELSSSDQEIADQRAAEERALRTEWESMEKAAHTEILGKEADAKGQVLFYKRSCLTAARTRLLRPEAERADRERWVLTRIHRLQTDLAGPAISAHQITVYKALLDLRKSVENAGKNAMDQVTALFPER